MGDTRNLDWWMHQLYQHTKEFISNPTREREQQLVSLLDEFRALHERPCQIRDCDEHEVLMDYR